MAFHQITDPRRLHALIDAILLIESDGDLTNLLESVVQTATELAGARYGALGVLASDGVTLSRFITCGLDPDVRHAIGEEPHGRGVLGEVVRLQAALRTPDVAHHPSSVGFPAHHPPMRQFLGVPVTTGDGHIYGNLYFCDTVSGEEFSAQDEALVVTFGRAAGLLIDQAQLRARLREHVLNEERERLARDLHDTVIQRLFGVGLSLQMTLQMGLPEPARERVSQSVDELDETIHEIRTTIFEIERNVTDSLSSAIATLTHQVTARLGLDTRVKLAPDLDDLVGDAASHHCVQALREILTNVVRHAEATRVDVVVTTRDQLVEVGVRDDGRGFIPKVGPGRGLRNLAQRAREYGGDCLIDSTPGRGTLVRWTANRLD